MNIVGGRAVILIILVLSFIPDSTIAYYFANRLLGMIESLAVITHFALINVNYPQNLQEFFS